MIGIPHTIDMGLYQNIDANKADKIGRWLFSNDSSMLIRFNSNSSFDTDVFPYKIKHNTSK